MHTDALTHDIEQRLSSAESEVEVLAVDKVGAERLRLFIDHPAGVDHALCERVTEMLDVQRRAYGIEVSSPGLERPLRKPAHFERVVGRKVALRTANDIHGRKRFRGQVVAAGDSSVQVTVGTEQQVDIPYESIVRGNLIDEG